MSQETQDPCDESIGSKFSVGCVLVGGIGAAATLCAAPFNALYILLAMGCGLLTFGVAWWGNARGQQWGFLGTIHVSLVMIKSQKLFSKEVFDAYSWTLWFQFFFVYMLVLGGLRLAFLGRAKRHRIAR